MLDLLRQGLANRQIADRLHVSVATANYHVSQILSKLGVGSREEAAAVEIEAAARPWWRAFPIGVLLPARMSIATLRLAAGGVLVAGALALVMLALGVLSMESREVTQPALGRLALIDDGHIWIDDLPDGPPRPITRDHEYLTVAWSPSGEWLLAARKTETGGAEFVVMARDGSDLRKMNANSCAWSPAEDLLAYNRADGAVVVEAADGSAVREVVTPQPTLARGKPLWSPDGRRLAYVQYRSGGPGGDLYSGIWVADLQTGDLRELASTNELGEEVRLAGWTADSSALFMDFGVRSASISADGLAWRLLPIDGPSLDLGANGGDLPAKTGLTVLVHEDFLVHSPDGTRSVVVDGGGRFTWTNKRLVLVDSSGVHAGTPLTEPGVAAIAPQWSPDGRRLAYVAQPTIGLAAGFESMAERRIWVIGADGAGNERLTQNEFTEEWPQWSNDGNYILYVRPDAGPSGSPDPRHASVWLRRLSDGHEQLLVDGVDYYINSLQANLLLYMGHYAWGGIIDWWQPSE